MVRLVLEVPDGAFLAVLFPKDLSFFRAFLFVFSCISIFFPCIAAFVRKEPPGPFLIKKSRMLYFSGKVS